MEGIREVLSYNHLTGVFTWVGPNKGRRVAGNEAGSVSKYGYRSIEYRGKSYRANILAYWFMTGSFPNKEIDHINQDKLDNSWNNLREVTPSINCHNRSQYSPETKQGKLPKGVYLRGGKYRSIIGINRKLIHLGTFDNSKDAESAYLVAKNNYLEESLWKESL